MSLVAYAWAGFGASFGPVILLSLFWKRLTLKGAYAGIISGAVIVLTWENIALLKSTGIYSILPAFVISIALAAIISKFDKPKNEVLELFDEALKTNV